MVRTRNGNLYHAVPQSRLNASGRDCNTLPKGWIKRDETRTPIALFVVDEFPVGTIKPILRIIDDEVRSAALWLADEFDSPTDFDYRPLTSQVEGTRHYKLDENWTSPFLGSSMQDCLHFDRNAPGPPKGLNAKFSAILQRDLYDADGMILICKARGDTDPQTIPCDANKVSLLYGGYSRIEWKECHRMQRLY